MEGECCRWTSMNNNFIQYGKYSVFTIAVTLSIYLWLAAF